jgi:uncharacterized RDD family membrane protein YckC
VADQQEPLKPDHEARIVVLEAGPRSILGRVLFFSFLGLLVLFLAGGQILLLIARERRISVAVDESGERHVLTARRLAPELNAGMDEEQSQEFGGWQLRDPKGKTARGIGFPRALSWQGGGPQLLFDDYLLRPTEGGEEGGGDREEFGIGALRALAVSRGSVLVHDPENRRLAYLEEAPGGRRRRELRRLGEDERFLAAALRSRDEVPHAAWLLRDDEGVWLEVSRLPVGEAVVSLSRRRLPKAAVGGLFAFASARQKGWLTFAKGERGKLILESWDDLSASRLGKREVEVGLPLYGGPFSGPQAQGAVFGAGADLITALPGRQSEGADAIGVQRDANVLESPWWGLILRGAIFLPVLGALAFGVLRTVMRSRSLIYAGARPGSLLKRLGALAIDVGLAEIVGLGAAMIAGAAFSLDEGIVAGFRVSGLAGRPEDVLGDISGVNAFRLAVSLLVLIFAGAWCEQRWGRTPGKWLLELEVIGRQGTPGWGEALQRRVLLISDLFLFSAFYAIVNPAHQRVGDVAADTVVVGSPRNQRTFVSVLTDQQDRETTGSKGDADQD